MENVLLLLNQKNEKIYNLPWTESMAWQSRGYFL